MLTRLLCALAILAALPQERPPKSYRLPSTDLKQQIIWGSTLEVPGSSLAFGGQDQKGDDGNPHTRIKVNGEWVSIYGELRDRNPDQKKADQSRADATDAKAAQARARFAWFEGEDVPPKKFRPGNSLGSEWDCEPPPRALSPIAWDAKSKLFILFGGDHLDCLMNDTWVFDPAGRRWRKRTPPKSPPPRANHTLEGDGEGCIVLKGGYTYTSSTDYVGGQYRDHNDGDWIYDVAADRWTGKDGVEEKLVYRTGRLHPDYYQQGPKPQPVSWAEIPANTWVATKPPQLPALNRDWGTAVLDPDHDLILRWSGGHSAHGGSDVLQYHLNTNRWELTMPVEFPLGQLYSNTEYPDGWNFNHRPWVTGHTYQSYGYEPNLKKMLFTGRKEHCYVWDPSLGDWTSRFAKPKDMVYGDCYYTLTITSTPAGLVCWTQQGKLFRFEKAYWVEIPLKGAKLTGSVVDNSTVVYDSKRDRLLFARKQYGDKTEFDGVLQTVDLKTGEVGALAPEGKEKAAGVSYLCQLRYDSTNDLVLAGCTLPEAEGFRRTGAYDCAGNRWVSLKIVGDDPSGKKGRNVSLGLMYDAKRKLFWAVDTNSQVYVLRVDVATADLKPL